MASEKTGFDALNKRHEEERKGLAAGVYSAWQPVKDRIDQLLHGCDGYEKAPPHVQKSVDRHRESFFREWGSEGRLAALMTERHTRERKRLAMKENLITEMRSAAKENNDRER